ncbi:hypothetical protein [Rhodococcus sp. ACPA1]|nr:hypothetical protein [Rhodococcus sp. ACPA1]
MVMDLYATVFLTEKLRFRSVRRLAPFKLAIQRRIEGRFLSGFDDQLEAA